MTTPVHLFDVVIRLHIHSCFASVSSGDVFLEKHLKLPFPPFVGLGLSDEGDWDTNLTEVHWDHHKQRFRCYAPSDKTLYDAALHKWPASETPTLKALVDEYLASGWEQEKS